MATSRVISQVSSLYTTTSPAVQTGTQTAVQLHRVQSVSHSWGVSRTNVNQFGLLAPISREITESPTATVDFSYFLVNFLNEYNLGFVTDGTTSAISGLLNKTQDEKNYFLVESAEGIDSVGDTSTGRVVYGVGNGFLRGYSTEAAVNGFPTSTVRVEGLNLVAYASPSGVGPAVDPTNGARGTGLFTVPTATTGVGVPVLKHGDITMSLGSSVLGTNLTDAKIQRYTLSFDLNREAQGKLGAKFSVTRDITFPINVTLSVEANQGDIATGSVSDLLCNDVSSDLSITLRKPTCTGSGPVAASFILKGAKLDSTNWNQTIGPNQTVSMQWTASLGGPADLANNLFMSGILT